jgi:hypothetical protein
MHKFLIVTAALFLTFSLAAEDEKFVKKRIVMAGDGEHDERIEEIIEKVEAISGEDGNVHVVVKRIQDGEVDVETYVTAPNEFHAMAPGMPHPPRAMMMKGRHNPMPEMSTEAANCVLKNIRNAASDAAAMAVVRACSTLNPVAEN